MSDELDSAWAHHEALQHEYEENLRQTHPEWFTHRGHAMKVSEMIVSKYLAKADFDEDQVCTIKGLRQEELEGDGENKSKWILYFREHAKGMVLNITSIRVLESAYGSESDVWIGKKVSVYVDPNVSFGGKVVGGLRLRPLKPKTPSSQASSPQAAVVASNEPTDDVPGYDPDDPGF